MSELKTMAKVDCSICDKECKMGTYHTINCKKIEGTFCEECYVENILPMTRKMDDCRKKKIERKKAEEERKKAEEERKKAEEEEKKGLNEEEEKIMRWRMAPSKHVWYISSVYLSKDEAPKYQYELPFNTKVVKLSALKKGDVLVRERAWATEDVVILCKVVRINKKTVSVEDCDQRGLLTPHSSADKIEITQWSEWKIIEY